MRERIICALITVAHTHTDETVFGPLLYKLAERGGAVRTTGRSDKEGLNDCCLPGAVRPPEDVGAVSEGDVARGPTANLLQAHALNHCSPLSSPCSPRPLSPLRRNCSPGIRRGFAPASQRGGSLVRRVGEEALGQLGR